MKPHYNARLTNLKRQIEFQERYLSYLGGSASSAHYEHEKQELLKLQSAFDKEFIL